MRNQTRHEKGELSMRIRAHYRLACVAIVLLLSGTRAIADGVPIGNDTVWRDDRG